MVGRSAIRCPLRSSAMRRVRRVGQDAHGRLQPAAEQRQLAPRLSSSNGTSASAASSLGSRSGTASVGCRSPRRQPPTAGSVTQGRPGRRLAVGRVARHRGEASRRRRRSLVAGCGGRADPARAPRRRTPRRRQRRRRRDPTAGAPGVIRAVQYSARPRRRRRRIEGPDEVLDRGQADRHAARREPGRRATANAARSTPRSSSGGPASPASRRRPMMRRDRAVTAATASGMSRLVDRRAGDAQQVERLGSAVGDRRPASDGAPHRVRPVGRQRSGRRLRPAPCRGRQQLGLEVVDELAEQLRRDLLDHAAAELGDLAVMFRSVSR